MLRINASLKCIRQIVKKRLLMNLKYYNFYTAGPHKTETQIMTFKRQKKNVKHSNCAVYKNLLKKLILRK